MITRKVTVNLPADQVEFLQKVAAEEHTTFTHVLCRSTNSEKFFLEQEKIGRKIIVEEPGSHILREVFR